MLGAGTLQQVLDSLAADVPIMDAAFGVDGTVAGTISYGAAANLGALAATADADVAADLTGTFRARVEGVKAINLYPVLGGAAVQRALDAHFAKGAGDLNRQLGTYAVRVSSQLRKIGFVLDAPNVFAPAVDPVASFAVIAPGNGNATIGQGAIDENQYAAGALSIVVDAMHGAVLNITVTLRDANGAQSQQVVVVPANTPAGTVIAIPGRHFGVAALTITGGTAGDAFHVAAPVERNVNL
jgi:hypothetical protein